MKTRIAAIAYVAQVSILCVAFSAFAKAEEHKAEPKKEAKPAAHGEAKPEAKHEAAKHETPAPKKEAPKSAEAAHQEKPSAAAPAEHAPPKASPVRRAAAIRPPSRPLARAARSVPAASAAKPATAAPPAPMVVQIKQEPARVEAILHVVPYGQGPGVPAFAGSGYGATGAYTIAAYPMDQPQPAAPSAAVTPATELSPTFSAPVPPVAPSYTPTGYPSGPPPIRNVLRVPKNALTNEGLVTLAQVGYDEDFILDLMRQKNCRFDTSVEGLAYMATHGLTERIVKAALKADADTQLAQQLEARR